jgi:pyruvate formate lyase activating enzyme
MIAEQSAASVSLEAASPYELRVGLGRNVPESDVKRSLDTGDAGFLHSFTTGSAVDGPGIRVVAWTAGCQFKCLYCHNPDTWNMMNGIPVPVEKAIEELGKYRHGLKIMQGGFTISGGEPLMQDRFVMRMFTAAREMGIHTALDTNGFLGSRLSDKELEQIDLVMLCVKAWDADLHRKLTGKDPEPSREFARRLAALNRPMWLRFVLVPGVTDTEEEVDALTRFAIELRNVQRVDVLPFHQMGRFKWEKLGLDYALENSEPPSAEIVTRVCEQFRAGGLVAV